jgi:hypothetical protein
MSLVDELRELVKGWKEERDKARSWSERREGGYTDVGKDMAYSSVISNVEELLKKEEAGCLS